MKVKNTGEIEKINLKRQFNWRGGEDAEDLWEVVHDYEGEHCHFDQKMLFEMITSMENKINELVNKLNSKNGKR